MTGTLNLQAFLPYRLSIASYAVSERIAGDYHQRFGLKVPEWRLMAVLGEGAPQTQRELGRVTRMDKVTVSRAAMALAERGLVSRVASARDGRSHHLALTKAGWSLYADISAVALRHEQAILAGFSATERALLGDMLVRLRDAADDLPDDLPDDLAGEATP